MRRFRSPLNSFLLFALLRRVFLPAQAGVIHGTVVRGLDGDTIEVMDVDNTSHRVRLAGTDAPEKSQPFSASSATRALLDMNRVPWVRQALLIPGLPQGSADGRNAHHPGRHGSDSTALNSIRGFP